MATKLKETPSEREVTTEPDYVISYPPRIEESGRIKGLNLREFVVVELFGFPEIPRTLYV